MTSNTGKVCPIAENEQRKGTKTVMNNVFGALKKTRFYIYVLLAL